MTNIIIPEDCENAPKKQYIKDFMIAFAKGNVDSILDFFADDIYWETIGGPSWNGKEAVAAMLTKRAMGEATELTLDNILSHGNRCAANGILKYPNGNTVAFCDVFIFTGHSADAKIKKLTAYGLEL